MKAFVRAIASELPPRPRFRPASEIVEILGYKATFRMPDNATLKRYGLSEEQYSAMHKAQDGMCAICACINARKNLAIDHCHTSGQVRGLLCDQCNTALGSFRDDINILKAAISYLERQNDRAACVLSSPARAQVIAA